MDASNHGQKSTVGTGVLFRRSISSTKKQRRDSFDRRLKSPAVQLPDETAHRFGGVTGQRASSRQGRRPVAYPLAQPSTSRSYPGVIRAKGIQNKKSWYKSANCRLALSTAQWIALVGQCLAASATL